MALGEDFLDAVTNTKPTQYAANTEPSPPLPPPAKVLGVPSTPAKIHCIKPEERRKLTEYETNVTKSVGADPDSPFLLDVVSGSDLEVTPQPKHHNCIRNRLMSRYNAGVEWRKNKRHLDPAEKQIKGDNMILEIEYDLGSIEIFLTDEQRVNGFDSWDFYADIEHFLNPPVIDNTKPAKPPSLRKSKK